MASSRSPADITQLKNKNKELTRELSKARAEAKKASDENARLLNELRESLDRQTATADILRAIAATPGDSQRALDTIAETAVRMFDAASVGIRRLEGGVSRSVAAAGPYATTVRDAATEMPLDPAHFATRCMIENRQIQIDPSENKFAREVPSLSRVPIGNTAFTPLTREGEAIGFMAVHRGEIHPFSPDELELMRGFAVQAVIAIENARLLTELNERMRDLSLSLERQTATSAVLRVIAESKDDARPVMQAIVEHASRLCDTSSTYIHTFAEGTLRAQAWVSSLTRTPAHQLVLSLELDRGTAAGRAMLEGRRNSHRGCRHLAR